MYFALGFLAAALLAMMFLPAFWRRAMRLSLRRLQALVPLSMEEVFAERDLLRAEFALSERRREQEMDRVKASKAQDLADIGVQAARVATLSAEADKALAQARDLEIERDAARKALAERDELLAATETALQEMTDRAQGWVENVRALMRRQDELGREKDALATRAAAHETRICELDATRDRLEGEAARLQEELTGVRAKAERLAGVESNLILVSGDLDAAQAKERTLEAAFKEARGNLSALELRRAEEVEHFEAALRQARAESRDRADRLDAARVENVALQGSLEALRRELSLLRQTQGAGCGDAAPFDARDVKALRAALIAFGERMIEAHGARPENEETPASRRA